MKLLWRLSIYSFFLLHSALSYAQDVGFSQFYDQPLLRNPALAGIFTGDVRFTTSYRNQWQSVTVPYRTFGLSSEIKFPVQIMNSDITATLGLQLMRDIAGTSEFSTTQVLPALNVSIPVGENSFVSGGFLGGIMQQRFDPSRLILNDQFVPGSNGTFSVTPFSNQVFNNTSVNYFDLSTGVSFKGGNGNNLDYYIGVGLFHLTNPSVGFFDGNKITLNKKAALNVGLSSSVGDAGLDELIFYGDYFDQYTEKFERVRISTTQFGVMYNHGFFNEDNKSITGGILCRWNDAIIPVLELELSKFIIGASYDVNISKLVVASQARGGFELTLSYKDFLNSRRDDLQGSKCPSFGKHRFKSSFFY